jgi:hypothetical protein
MTTTTLALDKPYTVPANIRFVRLLVTGEHDPLPTAVAAFTHRSPVNIGLRLAGGCANMSAQDKLGMLEFFGRGLRDFTGLVSSGGTREASNGRIDPMVTDVPALLAAQSPHSVVAISTMPRTGDLGLVDDSRLVLSDDGHMLPNPGVHMLILVQSHTGMTLGWDGDLNMYFDLFGNLVRHGGWNFGTVVYNGGGVTRKEALRAMALGWPVILVRGSGRQADVIIGEVEAGTLELPDYASVNRDLLSIVDNGDHAALRTACVDHGLIAA